MDEFDFGAFIGGYDTFAVSKKDAIEIAKVEWSIIKRPYYLCVREGFVRRCAGWRIEYNKKKGSYPCWLFHVAEEENRGSHCEYECILVG